MDLKLLLTTFGLVFIAELGDKTQLTTMALAADSDSLWPIFIGSSLGLVLSALLGTLFGGAITEVVPEMWINRAAGTGFLVIGALMLLGKI